MKFVAGLSGHTLAVVVPWTAEIVAVSELPKAPREFTIALRQIFGGVGVRVFVAHNAGMSAPTYALAALGLPFTVMPAPVPPVAASADYPSLAARRALGLAFYGLKELES